MQYFITDTSLAIIAVIPASFAVLHIFLIESISSSYITVFRARYDFTLCSLQIFATFFKSSNSKFEDLLLIFNLPTPKYTEPAPAFIAAINDS